MPTTTYWHNYNFQITITITFIVQHPLYWMRKLQKMEETFCWCWISRCIYLLNGWPRGSLQFLRCWVQNNRIKGILNFISSLLLNKISNWIQRCLNAALIFLKDSAVLSSLNSALTHISWQGIWKYLRTAPSLPLVRQRLDEILHKFPKSK